MKVGEQANSKDTSVSVPSASTTSQDEYDDEVWFDRECDTNEKRNPIQQNPHLNYGFVLATVCCLMLYEKDLPTSLNPLIILVLDTII
jgi:hypothetical protein